SSPRRAARPPPRGRSGTWSGASSVARWGARGDRRDRRTMATNYADYLRLKELLALQGGVSGEETELARDELLFLVVHQVDELWFKLILRELGRARDVFAQPLVHEQEIAPAAAALRRAVKTFELVAAHFALIETMSPRDFLDFRTKLAPASGFQSPQFRE